MTHTAVESNSSAAMVVRSNQMKNNSAGNARSDHSNRFYNGSPDSWRFDQNKHRPGSSRGRPQLTYCGEMGHFVKKCYYLHRYPPGHPKARTCSNFNHHKNTFVANQVSWWYKEKWWEIGVDWNLRSTTSIAPVPSEWQRWRYKFLGKCSCSKTWFV